MRDRAYSGDVNLEVPWLKPCDLAKAAGARLLVAISFHFAPDRLSYLEQVLYTLLQMPVKSRRVMVLTNTPQPAEQAILNQLFLDVGLVSEQEAQLVVTSELDHPYDLTWAHKQIITDVFLGSGDRYSHFAYLEDDERLTFENLAYFISARDYLRPFGLVPAFLRTEWNSIRECHVNIDNISAVNLSSRPFVKTRDCAFICVDNPYCGAFILDEALAQEYITSLSFDRDRSSEVSPWSVRERAAMGLTFENPPPPFSFRVAIPLSINSCSVPTCAWLAHLPNNYANNADSPFGKVTMSDLLVGCLDPSLEVSLQDAGRRAAGFSLEALLEPFRDHSISPRSILAIGCRPVESDESDPGGLSVAIGFEHVLHRLEATAQTGWKIVASKRITPMLRMGSLRDIEKTLVLSGDGFRCDVIVLPDTLLRYLMPPANGVPHSRAIAVLSGRAASSGLEDVRRLQRDLFDRGFIAVGSCENEEGIPAILFLTNQAVGSARNLGGLERGCITMTSLGDSGRLGNQLFQYGYAKLYALRHGSVARLPDWEYAKYFDAHNLSCEGISLPELRFGAFNDDDRVMWDMDDPPTNVDLHGYFQELPECWRGQRPLVRRLFSLLPEKQANIDRWRHGVTNGGERTLVAIHVRRGDYRLIQHIPFFRLVPIDFYLNWLRGIWASLRSPLLFIATDEPENVLPSFAEFQPIHAHPREAAQDLPDEVFDLQALRCADILAICNSSFSRMAAILADDSQRCFCPSFARRTFEPYKPWLDTSFWARFNNDKSDHEMGLSDKGVRERAIAVRVELGRAHKELERLREDAQKRNYEFERLRKDQHRLRAVYTSRSWRITAPLRWAMRFLRSF